jgi:hypothetical protein
VLSPAFVAKQFKPGQSGNPDGSRGAAHVDVVRLARSHSVDAVLRLVELMASDDERVALMASQALLDRAFGKPKDVAPAIDMAVDAKRQELLATLCRHLDGDAVALSSPVRELRDGAVPVLSGKVAPPPVPC